MIKKIINKIKSWFTPKIEQPIILTEKKPEHCSGHLRFRKSCPRCQELIAQWQELVIPL